MHFFRPTPVYLGLLCIGVFFALSSVASAQTSPAEYSLSPSGGSYGVGKTFSVSVVVDSSQTFNSGNALINFDKELLSVVTLSKSNSAFSLWAVDPSSSNSAGTVSFEGGNTTVLSGKKVLLEITFKTLKEGTAAVSFASGSILAADGKGTDILGAKKGASFTITASANDAPSAPAPTPVTTVNAGPLPDLPVITSPTHKTEMAYTNAAKAKFVWELPDDVSVVRLALDTKTKTVPTTSYDPALAEKEFDQLSDGVMYFHLRYKNDAGWGPTAHRKIMVDKTPPPPFTLKVSTDASSTDALLLFSATDTLSSIAYYEVTVDTGKPLKVMPPEVTGDGYRLIAQTPGTHKVSVAAYDGAGNTTAQEESFTIAGTVATKKITEEEEKPIDWRLIGDIALVALVVFLIGQLWYGRSVFRHEKYLARREADELRDSVGNIFGAIQEEVGEQVAKLFQKPNPSAQDRETTKNINEAIDLSEELLSKEVEDVRKLLQ